MFAPVSLPSRLDRALASLSAAADAVRREAAAADTSDVVGPLLRTADRLTATALEMVARGGFEAHAGMPPVQMLQLHAGRPFSDARALTEVAGALSAMPRTAAALSDGTLTYAQARTIVYACRPVHAAGRARVDDLVGRLAGSVSDPDEVLARVDHLVAELRADLAIAREERQIDRNFVAIQGRLDGSSSTYMELDATSTATFVETLDAFSAGPVSPDEEDAPSRAEQRADALIAICESALSGSGSSSAATRTRPRPRLLATVDLDAPDGQGARLLWALAGRAPRLTALTTEVLLCDAELIPVAFKGGEPVGVGDPRRVPDKLRAALIARDGRCRFPGCRAPVQWTDVHHVLSPNTGGRSEAGNCLLLCRQHHRIVHRYGWKIQIHRGGVIDFTRRGKTFNSQPHKHVRT